MPTELTHQEGLLELVRRTKRYSICEVEPGRFEVSDERYLLDRLLRLPELRVPTHDPSQIRFEEALEALSFGATLTSDDQEVLHWLMLTAEALDPEGDNTALNDAYDGAVLFRGTLNEVEYFMRAALDHRVHP